MRQIRKNDDINKRCEFLRSIGFEINHIDVSVSMGGIDFDFSAIRMDVESILRSAIEKAYSQGFKDGGNNIKNEFKSLMAISKD